MLSLTTLLACSTTPTFPLDYYTGEQVNLLQYTDASRSDTNVCCAPSAANCQLKVESTGSDAYTQGSQGRVLTNAGGHGTQLQWFDPINKLMGLAPGSTTNSSHKWVCALYCPQSGKYVPDLDIGAGGEKVSDLGRQNVTQAGAPGDASKVCETYQWTQHLFHILPIAQLTMWVDDKNASSPAPFLKELEIYDPTHPLKKDVLIRGNTSYLGFTPGDHWADMFDIDMDSVKSCKRQEFGKCPNDPHIHPPSAPHDVAADEWRRAEWFKPSLEDLAVEAAASGQFSSAAEGDDVDSRSAAGVPIFANDTITVELSSHLIAQGSETDGADICCDLSAPACQVQRGHDKSTFYRDVSHQRVRSEHSDGSIVIDFFDSMKAVKVNITAGVETCEEYCPIPEGEILRPFGIPPKATDKGPATVLGKSAEHYTWKDIILKIIPMASYDFYATVADNGAPTPVFQSQALTPLGRLPPIGRTNVTWLNYTAATPPAAKFNIAGLDTCPHSSQCAGPGYQAHRLAAGQLRSFEHYYRPAM